MREGSVDLVNSKIDPADAHNYILVFGWNDVPPASCNAQNITATLPDVNDAAGNHSDSVSVTMGLLIGDTTNSAVVNSADISQTKSQSGQNLTNVNFREDLNADGSINSGDISLAKSRTGTAIP